MTKVRFGSILLRDSPPRNARLPGARDKQRLASLKSSGDRESHRRERRTILKSGGFLPTDFFNTIGRKQPVTAPQELGSQAAERGPFGWRY